MKEISPRQLQFVKAYCAGKSGAEAARIAGYGKDPSKAAERPLANPLVKAEVDRVKSRVRDETGLTAVAYMEQLKKREKEAAALKQSTAVSSLLALQGKAAGLLVEKVDQRVQGTGFAIHIEGIRRPGEELVEGEVIEMSEDRAVRS